MGFLDWITTETGMITIKIIIIALVTVAIAKVLNYFFTRSIKREGKYAKNHKGQIQLLKNTVSVFIYVLGLAVIVYTIPSLRTLSISLLAGAGILAIVIGFASQHAFSNMIGGIAIILSKPYRIGDRVRMDNGQIFGVVEDITLRHTVVKDFENNRFFVPNSIASNSIVENHTIGDSKVLKQVEFQISYESDIDKASEIIKKIVRKHPAWIDTRTKKEIKEKVPDVNVRVVGLQDSGILLKVYAWTKDPGSAFALSCDVRKSVKETFDRSGIGIPYPHRTIVHKDGKKLRKYA